MNLPSPPRVPPAADCFRRSLLHFTDFFFLFPFYFFSVCKVSLFAVLNYSLCVRIIFLPLAFELVLIWQFFYLFISPRSASHQVLPYFHHFPARPPQRLPPPLTYSRRRCSCPCRTPAEFSLPWPGRSNPRSKARKCLWFGTFTRRPGRARAREAGAEAARDAWSIKLRVKLGAGHLPDRGHSLAGAQRCSTALRAP